MSYKPTRSFMGYEGVYSVDYYGPEAIKRDLDEIMAMFDPSAVHEDGEQGGLSFENLNFDFGDSGMAARIGALDSKGKATFVQTLLDLYAQNIGDRYTKEETDHRIDEETHNLIEYFDLDFDTGVITIVTKDGQVTEYDTILEKVPVKFELTTNEYGQHILKVTNDDGSTSSALIEELFNYYDLIASDTIKITKGTMDNGLRSQITTFTPEVKNGSITLAHLATNIVSTFEQYKDEAAASAENAKAYEKLAKESMQAAAVSENNAAQSSLDSKAYAEGSYESKQAAAVSENNAAVSEDNAAQYAQDCGEYAINASDSAIAAEKIYNDTVEIKTDVEVLKEEAVDSCNDAANYASAASNSADAAAMSEKNAAISEINAKQSEISAADSATTALNAKQVVLDVSNLSKSYAVGGTGTRDGEDTDNAKYYKEWAKNYKDMAKDIAGGDFATETELRLETERAMAAEKANTDSIQNIIDTRGDIYVQYEEPEDMSLWVMPVPTYARIYVQSGEPNINNCFWIYPVSMSNVEAVLLNLSSDDEGSKFLATIDGNTSSVTNIVDSNDITDGNYAIEVS